MAIFEFDDFEVMLEAIRKSTERAKAAATPEQNAITYGDYWRRNWWTGYEYVQIFGYIMTPEELYSSPAYDDVPLDELEWEKNNAQENYDNGYRFGRAYSEIVPEGELGDTHVSEMTKITKEEFEEAKANGWRL